jgi:WD40 repeat protein
MRFLSTVLVCLTLSPTGFSQTKPVLRLNAKLDFTGPEKDRIVTYKFLDGRNELLLVGTKSVRIVDVTNGNVLESRRIDIPELNEDNTRVISPDGRKMVVFGNHTFRDKKNKVKRPPAIWDLQSGKQIAVLDKSTQPILAAFWSSNGKTLATASDRYAPLFTDGSSVLISFWNGETFAFRNSLPATRVNWWHLTADGDKCFYSTGPAKSLLFIVKYIGDTGGPINVWDIKDGRVETTISAHDGQIERQIRGIEISPDEKFLTFVAQTPKSKPVERRLIVREIDRSGLNLGVTSKYEIEPTPKIYEHGVTFSPDGRYFALPVDKNLQVYETVSGEKRFELPNIDRSPSHWLSDNKILLFDYSDEMVALETATGKELYRQPLVFAESYYTDSDGTSASEVVDQTTIMVHPTRDLLLTYSNQLVKVYNARTGEIVQVLVTPPIDTTKPLNPKKGLRLSSKPLVWKADWSSDGRTIYIISADRGSVALWEL